MGVIIYSFEKAGTNWESERAWGLFVIFLFFFWLFVNLLVMRWVLLSKFNKLIVIPFYFDTSVGNGVSLMVSVNASPQDSIYMVSHRL